MAYRHESGSDREEENSLLAALVELHSCQRSEAAVEAGCSGRLSMNWSGSAASDVVKGLGLRLGDSV